MVDLKTITDEEIVELIKQGVVTNAELTDAGICPTCFDNEHGHVLFGDISDKILYEDEYLLIVNKPSNMPVHPSSDNYENTLSNIVASYLKKQNIYNIHIITRLDKDTTGVCIFAKNSYIQE